ncbi:MAG: hypothetical protein ACLFPU_06695 [Dehalococcoidia bacterium]
MDWNEYRQVYLSFELSMAQTAIIAHQSAYILEDYPNNLPPDVSDKITETMKKFVEAASQTVEETQELDFEKLLKDREPETYTAMQSFLPTLMMGICNWHSGRDPWDVDFAKLVYSQQLAMAFAHFDAFLGDTLRTMLNVQPNILRKNRQVTWDTIIKLGSWERLIEHMMEDFVYKVGRRSAKEKMDFFLDEFNFDLQLSDQEIDAITEGERLRHLIVHNGGRVNADYLNRTKMKNMNIGDQISIDYLQVFDVCIALHKAAYNLYVQVSRSFFKTEETGINPVPVYYAYRRLFDT